MPAIDIFHLYRNALALVCGCYAVIRLLQAVWVLLAAFEQEAGVHGALLRRYLATQLLRVRLRSFGWNLLQVVLLAVVLTQLLVLHR